MSWSMETKRGYAWATAVVVVFLGSIWAMAAIDTVAFLVLPVLTYVGFLAWVNRVK